MSGERRSEQPPRALLLFDYDGVVADSLQYFLDAFLEACRRHGYRQICDREGFLRLFDVNMYEGMQAAGMPVAEHDPLLRTMARLLSRCSQRYDVFAGMKETLSRLAQRHLLYIITSNTAAVVRADLRHFGIDSFAAVRGSEAGRSKVEKIRALCTEHPRLPAYYIGDTAGDMHEGRRAGVRTVAACWGWHEKSRLLSASPDYMAEAPARLESLFGV